MALSSPHVRSSSVEAQEFPELASYYAVSAVPKIVVNDTVEFLGALPEPMFLEAVMSALPQGAAGAAGSAEDDEAEGEAAAGAIS